MAVTVALLDSGTATDDATFTTGSFTAPASGQVLIYAAIANPSQATSESWALPTGLSGTYTQIHLGTYGSRRAQALWYGTGLTGTGTVTLQYTGTNSGSVYRVGRAVVELTGAHASTAYDGQAETSTAGATSLNPTVTGTTSAGDATVS